MDSTLILRFQKCVGWLEEQPARLSKAAFVSPPTSSSEFSKLKSKIMTEKSMLEFTRYLDSCDPTLVAQTLKCVLKLSADPPVPAKVVFDLKEAFVTQRSLLEIIEAMDADRRSMLTGCLNMLATIRESDRIEVSRHWGPALFRSVSLPPRDAVRSAMLSSEILQELIRQQHLKQTGAGEPSFRPAPLPPQPLASQDGLLSAVSRAPPPPPSVPKPVADAVPWGETPKQARRGSLWKRMKSKASSLKKKMKEKKEKKKEEKAKKKMAVSRTASIPPPPPPPMGKKTTAGGPPSMPPPPPPPMTSCTVPRMAPPKAPQKGDLLKSIQGFNKGKLKSKQAAPSAAPKADLMSAIKARSTALKPATVPPPAVGKPQLDLMSAIRSRSTALKPATVPPPAVGTPQLDLMSAIRSRSTALKPATVPPPAVGKPQLDLMSAIKSRSTALKPATVPPPAVGKPQLDLMSAIRSGATLKPRSTADENAAGNEKKPADTAPSTLNFMAEIQRRAQARNARQPPALQLLGVQAQRQEEEEDESWSP